MKCHVVMSEICEEIVDQKLRRWHGFGIRMPTCDDLVMQPPTYIERTAQLSQSVSQELIMIAHG